MDALLRRLFCCFGARHRQGRPRERHGGRGCGGRDDDDAANKKSFLRRAVERLETPRPRRRRWPRPRGMNRVFARSPPCGTTARAGEPRPAVTDDATAATAAVQAEDGGAGSQEFSVEHAAAATIQAHFRGHLARQAFRALRSLVKLQAFARGSYVRKQASVAIRCMKVLVRLQVRVRSRQLLLLA
ncbi:protein IQ-DOMAIN 31-like [Panicum miliaceum]|uniref:Protein IQ-DOMAIN 31-like n=1 Tax=Panicum miliaceum TaxID=4540 RepID=A0A3L6Q598_PANMI|nr:protein IQ-DOMAIN 31-like [Panicum miliaceum]